MFCPPPGARARPDPGRPAGNCDNPLLMEHAQNGGDPAAEALPAQEVLALAARRFAPRMAMACSFQKEESVLLHLLSAVSPPIPVFTLDTGVLFPETVAIWKEFETRFEIEIERLAVLPGGTNAWTAQNCCSTRKVEVVRERLSELDAWVTGIRREQAPGRRDAPKLGWDGRNGLWKVNPLADWTGADVWDYIRRHDLPYNPLHDRGYDSIGCAPCTSPGSGREGRWAGDARTECGLHGDS